MRKGEKEMANVAVMLADGFEEIEALAVVDILRRGGIDVSMVSIMGRIEVEGSHNIRVQADILFDAVDFSKMDMVVLPGGLKGKENLEAFQPLAEVIRRFDAENKYLAAICAAPTILGHMGLLRGRTACCYGGMESELEGATVSMEPVTKDGNVITSRGMGTAVAFGLGLLAEFSGQDAAKRMAKKIML